MKIIFLNALNAELKEPLAQFLREHAGTTDIFCFQEAGQGMRELCAELISGHEKITDEKRVSKREYFHQAIYFKNGVRKEESASVLKTEKKIGLGLFLEAGKGDQLVSVCNVHGLALPGEKCDSPGRLMQTEGIIKFMAKRKIPRIIGGDFNVLPETQSILKFEEAGYRNLIKDFNIRTTRNEFSWKKYPDNPLYYSDYVFVSPDVRVKSFSVPDMEISDHLPMILEIDP